MKIRTKTIRTMAEFSEYVGISRPTVSRYFNDPKSVRHNTRERIENAIQSSGYRPNLLAVNLNRRQSKLLGIIVPTLFDPFYMAVTRKIDQIAASRGYLVLVQSSDGKPELEAEAIQTFASMNVAGSIIAPVGKRTAKSPLRNIKQDMPLIALDSPLDDETSFVGTDNAQSVSLMVHYLCRSCEPPVFFDIPSINNNALLRRQSYAQTMEQLGHEPCYAVQDNCDSWDFEKFAFNKAISLFSQKDFSSNTILCANDRLAFGVIAAAYQSGLKVGRASDCDISVAGHDNQPLSAYVCPPLTTVSQNYNEIGRIAIELLLSKLEVLDAPHEVIDNQVLLNGELVLRESA